MSQSPKLPPLITGEGFQIKVLETRHGMIVGQFKGQGRKYYAVYKVEPQGLIPMTTPEHSQAKASKRLDQAHRMAQQSEARRLQELKALQTIQEWLEANTPHTPASQSEAALEQVYEGGRYAGYKGQPILNNPYAQRKELVDRGQRVLRVETFEAANPEEVWTHWTWLKGWCDGLETFHEELSGKHGMIPLPEKEAV